jgi:hypothetical protein
VYPNTVVLPVHFKKKEKKKKELKPLFLNTRIIRGIIMASRRLWKQDLKAKGSAKKQNQQNNYQICTSRDGGIQQSN